MAHESARIKKVQSNFNPPTSDYVIYVFTMEYTDDHTTFDFTLPADNPDDTKDALIEGLAGLIPPVDLVDS